MDLIERYLAAIGRQLPDKQAGDIVSELRDVLLSRVEDQEATLGRPLNRPELEALLVDFGHPLTVAGRYRRTQYLIGPEVFPFWWAAVKVMLSIVAGVYLVLIVLGGLTHKTPAEFNRTVPSIWYVAVYLFGLITLVCMGIERFGKARILQRWKPANLPPAGGKRRSPFEIGLETAIDVVFILWWAGLIHFRNFIPYPGALRFDLAPIWDAWRWPILAYFTIEIVANLIALLRPSWRRANLAILVGRYLFGIGILIAVIRAGHWIVASSTELPPEALAMLQTNCDLGMRIGIGLTIFGMAVRIGLEGWRQRRFRQAQAGGLRPA
jgi:hypothetical protein